MGEGMKMRRNNQDEGDVPCTTSAVETPFQDPPRSKNASEYKWHMYELHTASDLTFFSDYIKLCFIILSEEGKILS
jgi:hypothetical protein